MIDPARHPDHPAVRHWQSLVDRGLIGALQPTDPAVRARILAAEAVACPQPRAGAVW